MKRKIVALYSPYLDVMGGGEKHILSVLKVLQEQGFDVVIFWDTDLNAQIQKNLHLNFTNKIIFRPNIFKNAKVSAFSKFQILGEFDIFIYVTDGSYFFSSAKKNFIFSMIPQKSLYDMTLFNRLKTSNYQYISNSYYTQGILQNWGVESKVLYPYIQNELLQNFSVKKKKIILLVGRFFKHLHSKRQDVAISWFKTFQEQDQKFQNYRLVLAGNLRDEDMDYFNELQSLAKGNQSIEFYPNLTFIELLKLYKEAEIYWHFAGIDVDVSKNPENVEHLGITPLEAMASGCLVFAYAAGGLKEIIQDGKNGYLFTSQQQLFSKLGYALFDEINKEIICDQAKRFVETTFAYPVFSKTVLDIML